MKRGIVIGLVILLLVTLTVGSGFGEEAVTAPRSFETSLQEWAQGLSLTEHGYEGRAEWNGQTVSGSLQQQDGVLEIGLGEAGRLLVSERELAFDNGWQRYILDLESILKTVQQNAEKQNGQMLKEILLRLFREVIQPSVQFSLTTNGIAIHLDLDPMILIPRLKDSLEALMQEEDAAGLIREVLPVLHLLTPYIPADAEKLLDRLSDFRMSQLLLVRRTLNADLFIELQERQLKSVSCVAQLPLGKYGSLATLSLDFHLLDNGFVLKAIYDDYGKSKFRTLDMSVELLDGQLSAVVTMPWETYTLNASWDPENGAFQAVYTPPESWAQVRISGTLRKGDLSAVIHYCEDEIKISFNGNEQQGHFSLNSSTPVESNREYHIDARYFRAGEKAYRLIVTDKEASPPYWTDSDGFYLNCLVSPGQVQFLYYPLMRSHRKYRGEATWTIAGDNFSLNLAYSRPYYHYYKPGEWVISAEKDGSTVKVGFAYPYQQFDVRGEASLLLGPDGLPLSLYGEASAGYPENPDLPRDTTTVIWNPGFAAVSGSRGVYRLERITDTETERTWKLTVNADREMLVHARLEELEDGTALLLNAEADGQNPALLEIRPVAKKEIKPVNRTNATVIDAEALKILIQMNPRSR